MSTNTSPLIKAFHENMHGKVQCEGNLFDRFPIKRGVKQVRVLTSTLFGTYFFFVFRQAYLNLDKPVGISILSSDDSNFGSLSHNKARSRVQAVVVRELLYADDAALCASPSQELQCFLDAFLTACNDFGLTISPKKTVTLQDSTQVKQLWRMSTVLNTSERQFKRTHF